MAATNLKENKTFFAKTICGSVDSESVKICHKHFFILLKCSIGLAGKAPFYGVAPLQDPNKYLNGWPFTSCYGARLGCKFHSI